MEKVKVFLFDAGKVIIAISIILWVLSSNAPSGKFEKIEKEYASVENSGVIIQSKKFLQIPFLYFLFSDFFLHF